MMFLAIRHLLARKKQTLLIFSGIVLGTLIYVFIAGMQLGFREFIIQQLVENDAHLKIQAHEEDITPEKMTDIFFPEKDRGVSWYIPPFGKRGEAHILYPQGWFEKLNNSPEVVAYAEQLASQVIVSRGGVKETGQIIGVVPEKQRRVTVIEDYIIEGKYEAIGNSGNRVAVGSGLLKKVGARVGDTILLSTGTGESRPFKIVAAFELGVHQIDESFIYGALRDVQSLNRTPGRISQISVRLVDVTKARDLANGWAQFGRDKVQSWDQANANFLQVFEIQDLFRNFITIGILVVAAFGIYNVLSIIVNQKKREIAILRSLGYPPRDILVLFFYQGVILGVSGALVGLVFGYGVCWYMANLDLEIMGRRGLTISFNPEIYWQGFFMSTVSSILAGILPARAASKFTPIDIIRMEG